MTRRTKHGKEVVAFILQNIEVHPQNIARLTTDKFGITRQAVNRFLRELVADGLITSQGKTSQRRYALPPLQQESFHLPLQGLHEDAVWRNHLAALLDDLPSNVRGVWEYAASEMINNAIDHSDGTTLSIQIERNSIRTRLILRDDGVGIFRKIKEACHLEDERHAVLELAKGKLTTDPQHHTGEGIFFTSRMLDDFAVLSGDVYFTHEYGKDENWILQQEKPSTGTAVFMTLANHSPRTSQEIFEEFASEKNNYGFNKTVVPVRLARQGLEQLVSRSQAKRLLARIDRFQIVIFDFVSVETIGPAFADEIFRVFERSHPNIRLLAVNASTNVSLMIARARAVQETPPIQPPTT